MISLAHINPYAPMLDDRVVSDLEPNILEGLLVQTDPITHTKAKESNMAL